MKNVGEYTKKMVKISTEPGLQGRVCGVSRG